MARIDLHDASVHFPVIGQSTRKLTGSLGGLISGARLARGSHSEVLVKALNRLNFSIEPGDRVGIIGTNGAGKTTLLRLLAGLLPPTEGEIKIDGDITSLLSIQSGFQNHASGLENIKLRSRLMGRSRLEVEERLPEIIRFADLGDYLYLPFNTYSSGMRFRLAFSIATAFSAEIVLMDEWISTGDSTFRDKASDKLTRMVDAASILAIASHTRNLHYKLCNKGLVLVNGEVRCFSDLEEAFDMFDREVLGIKPVGRPKEKESPGKKQGDKPAGAKAQAAKRKAGAKQAPRRKQGQRRDPQRKPASGSSSS